MIVIDTSAVIAITTGEPTANACISAVRQQNHVAISAGTVAESMIVASARGVTREVIRLIDDADIEVVPVTDASARRIGGIYRKWGKGFHPAALNFGDCFAYELATSRDCPLLFVGDDFSATDVKRAL